MLQLHIRGGRFGILRSIDHLQRWRKEGTLLRAFGPARSRDDHPQDTRRAHHLVHTELTSTKPECSGFG